MATLFPKWTNRLPTLLAGGTAATLIGVVGVVWYYFTPEFWEVGYMPSQPALPVGFRESIEPGDPVPGETFPGFSHQVHGGKLGLDCRYCHTHVESSAEANIPSVSTCMNCHTQGRLGIETEDVIGKKLTLLRKAYEQDESMVWRRVHKLPEYVRNFPHDVHLNAGVSCYSCHGMVSRMAVVHQVHSLSMSWCLSCHENPGPHLIDKSKMQVTDLFSVEQAMADRVNQPEVGDALLNDLKSKPLHLAPNGCGSCHY